LSLQNVLDGAFWEGVKQPVNTAVDELLRKPPPLAQIAAGLRSPVRRRDQVHQITKREDVVAGEGPATRWRADIRPYLDR
jgi:hypothetical protein